MEKYESKQVQIMRPVGLVYGMLSDLSNFTPVLKDKVENWDATADGCSFSAKGFTVRLRVVEREVDKLVKIEGEDGSPVDFTLWIQMMGVTAVETRMRLVVHMKLNMMMKMMIGGKIQGALNKIAEGVAVSFNNAVG